MNLLVDIFASSVLRMYNWFICSGVGLRSQSAAIFALTLRSNSSNSRSSESAVSVSLHRASDRSLANCAIMSAGESNLV